MFQYLRADFWRIGHRIPRWAIWILSMVAGAAVIFSASGQKSFNYVQMGDSMGKVLKLFTALLAMFNLYFVYEDDLQVKSMQIAIGRGVGRFQVIFSKWLQMVILSIADCVSLVLVMSLTGFLTKGAVLRDHAARTVETQIICAILTVAVMTAITMIFIFYNMHVGIMQIVFLALYTIQPLTQLMSFLQYKFEFLMQLQPVELMPGRNLENFQQMLTAGQFGVKNMIFIILYCVLGMGITYMIFAKKELDF